MTSRLLRLAAGCGPAAALAAAMTLPAAVSAAPTGPAAAVAPSAHVLVPIPLPPPLPASPLGRSLGSAYGAILSALSVNPAAAQAANLQYSIARRRLAAGDVAGALAAADLAQSLAVRPPSAPLAPASAGGSLPYAPSEQGIPGIGTLRQPAPHAPTGTTPATGAVPLTGGPLSMQLLVARNEIELAERLPGAELSAAKAQYRAALDRYQSGDAAGANAAARRAYALAARHVEDGR